MTNNKTTTLKLVFIGDFNSGKSSIIQRYVENTYDENAQPRILAEFLKKEIKVDDKFVFLQFWDTACQENYYSPLPIPYYRGADCIILCFDITSKESFENINKWKDEAIERNQNNNNLIPPIILFGCKFDLKNKRQVINESIEKWCTDNNNTPYFEISSKDNINIDTAFQTVAKMALDFNILKHDSIKNGGIIYNLAEEQRRGDCPCN